MSQRDVFGRCVSLTGRVDSDLTDNAINGKPTCADPWLLQDVARDAWGFVSRTFLLDAVIWHSLGILVHE